MTKIEETGNKILAHFMGVEYSSDLNYHEDWNKLMPVWKKLATSEIKPVNEFGNRVRLDAVGMATLLTGDCRTAWSLITGFINKWYLTEEEYKKLNEV